MDDSNDNNIVNFFSYEKINEYSSNVDVINFFKEKFTRLSRTSAVLLIKRFLSNRFPINIDEICKNKKWFYHYNMSKFDEQKNLKKDFIISLKRELNGFLKEIDKDLIAYNEEEHKDVNIVKVDGKECYILDKYTTYEKIRRLVCEEGIDVCLKYDFTKNIIDTNTPNSEDKIQHIQIQILSRGIKFDYPIKYNYRCPVCGNVFSRFTYELVSTNERLRCEGIHDYTKPNGEIGSKICGTLLYPDRETSQILDGYYYDISYDDENGNKISVPSFSLNNYLPGFYECVLFRIKNPRKTEFYQIVDIKPIKNNIICLPEKNEEENYIYTLQKYFDKYIKAQTDMEIFGLIPIKISMIIQKAINCLNNKLKANIQIVGDASTGKSTVLKYYGYLLDSHLHLSTDGLSISVPGLRGTRETISLLGKDIKIITTGHLGTYKSIHIDEAGENKELIQNLKIFLFENNYTYNKAGGSGTFRKRTTHVNVSENLDYEHLGQYRGMIRKHYKDMNIKIGEENREEWNESWDLHQPIFTYTWNPYLYKSIKDVRDSLRLQHRFWIDGYDYALHERFPFYFYLVNDKENKILNQVIKDNVARGTISENLELIRALKNDDIDSFFNNLNDWIESEENEIEAFDKVDKIFKEYDLNLDSRQKEFYYDVLKVSRIVNKRKNYKEMDFKLICYIIENVQCKLDISETNSYELKGAPNLQDKNKVEEKIENSNTEFGSLPQGEFD